MNNQMSTAELKELIDARRTEERKWMTAYLLDRMFAVPELRQTAEELAELASYLCSSGLPANCASRRTFEGSCDRIFGRMPRATDAKVATAKAHEFISKLKTQMCWRRLRCLPLRQRGYNCRDVPQGRGYKRHAHARPRLTSREK